MVSTASSSSSSSSSSSNKEHDITQDLPNSGQGNQGATRPLEYEIILKVLPFLLKLIR
jgi:hypothetical protein